MLTEKYSVKPNLRLGHNPTEAEAESAAVGVKASFIPSRALVFEKSKLSVPYRGDGHGLGIPQAVKPRLAYTQVFFIRFKAPRYVKAACATYAMLVKKSCCHG
jgi:hypothetical protein